MTKEMLLSVLIRWFAAQNGGPDDNGLTHWFYPAWSPSQYYVIRGTYDLESLAGRIMAEIGRAGGEAGGAARWKATAKKTPKKRK